MCTFFKYQIVFEGDRKIASPRLKFPPRELSPQQSPPLVRGGVWVKVRIGTNLPGGSLPGGNFPSTVFETLNFID